MVAWMAVFCAGVIILYCSGTLLLWHHYIFVSVCAFLFAPARSAIFIVIFISGFGYASVHAHSHLQSILPESLEGRELEVHGYICSLPNMRGYYSEIKFCASKVLDPKGQRLLSGSHPMKLYFGNAELVDFARSEHRFLVKLKRPHGLLNPAGSSYEQHLFHENITATGTILASLGQGDVEWSLVKSFKQQLLAIRYGIYTKLDIYLDGLEHAGLIQGLLLGDRSKISALDNQVLRGSGTQHLMAISGLHVGIIIFLLCRLLPLNRFGFLAIGLISLAYTLLVGFGPSAQRAWIMSLVALMVISGYQRGRMRFAYILAMSIVLVIDPLATLGLGFWFSFIAVAVLILMAKLRVFTASLMAIVGVQLTLMVGLSPVYAVLGLPQSLSHILANLVLIPWVSILVLPVSLISFVFSLVDQGLSRLLFVWLNEVLHVLMTFLGALVDSDLSEMTVRVNDAPLLILVLVTILLTSRIRWLSLVLVLVMGLYLLVPIKQRDSVSEVVVFDSGQGLAILARSEDVSWIYDSGPAFGQTSVAERVILPYTRRYRVGVPIEGVILSHGDADHAGGIESLIEALQPQQLWLGEPERLKSPRESRPCFKGMAWSSGAMRIEVLYPEKGDVSISSNNRSCVVRVSINHTRFLLMGDLEGEGERHFLQSYRGNLKSEVLIAGHHGSKNATSYALLKRVNPGSIVFSAGYLNRFGHPHSDVITRAKQFGTKVYNTASDGAIVFHVKEEGRGFIAEVLRSNSAPFWIMSCCKPLLIQ